MRIRIEDGAELAAVDDAALDQALAALNGDTNTYFVLDDAATGRYLEVTLVSAETYALEHGNPPEQTVRALDLAATRQACRGFVRGSRLWRSRVDWRPMVSPTYAPASESAGSPWVRRLVIGLFLCLGLGAVVTAGWLSLAADQFAAVARPADGTVLRFERGKPVISFTTAAGQYREVVSAAVADDVRAGDTVDLLYDPADPGRADLVEVTQARVLPLVLALVGGAILLVVLGLAWLERQPASRALRVSGGVFLGVAVVFLAIAAFTAVDEVGFQARAVAAIGHVATTTRGKPTVAFTTVTGDVHTVTLALRRRPGGYPAGMAVDLVYDPWRPSHARARGEPGQWVLAGAMAAGGAVFLVFGLLLTRAATRQRQPLGD